MDRRAFKRGFIRLCLVFFMFLMLSPAAIHLASGLTQNINPNARSVNWGTEPLGWDVAWLQADDGDYYKVYREQVVSGYDYEGIEAGDYDAVTGTLDFGTLSDLLSFNDVYMGFSPSGGAGAPQNSYDNASAQTIIYGNTVSGSYLDTPGDDDTVHTIEETDEGTSATNTENNVDNNGSDVGAPTDVGTENNFGNAQSDPEGTYMDVTEEDLGSSATNTENNADNNGSDVDGSPDVGTENNFGNAQSDPEGTYMDVTEANQAGGGGSEWLNVNANTTFGLWTTYIGAEPYLDAQDQPTNYMHTKTDGDIAGYFLFTDTGLTGSGISVNFSVYGLHDDGATSEITYLWWGHNGTYYQSPNLGFANTWEYKVYSITSETFTAAQVNSMQVYFEYDKVGGGDENRIDHARIGTSQTGGGDDYEIDFEYQWTTLSPLDDTNEELCIYVQATFPTENLLVKIRDSSSWVQIDTLDGTGWFNVSITGYLDNAQETIQIIGANEASESTQDTWNIGYIGVHTWTDANPDYELDFEYQWTTLNPLDDTNEELCIYVQTTFPTENFNIDIWDGSWINIDTVTGIGWHNTSITGYLNAATETIRIVDVDKASEDVQDTWNIGYIGIHTWTAAVPDYQLSLFYTINVPVTSLDNYYVNMSCSRTAGGDDFTLYADAVSLGTISSTSETYFSEEVTSQISDNVLYLEINDTLADDVTSESISIDWLTIWGYTAGAGADYDLEIIFGFDSAQAEADIVNLELSDQSNCTSGGDIAVQIENNTQTTWHTVFNVDSDIETDHYWNGSTYNPTNDLLNSSSGFRLRYFYENAGSQYNLTIDRLNGSITYQLYEYRVKVLFNFTFAPNFDAIQAFNITDRSFIGAGSISAHIYNWSGSSWDSAFTVSEAVETKHTHNTSDTSDYIKGDDLITIRYLGNQGATDYLNLTLDLLEIDIEYTVSEDSDPPTITLDAPLNNTWSYVNKINLSITDTSGVDQAHYRFSNYTSDLSKWTLLPSPYDIDVSGFDEGVYSLWVIANDTVGNPGDIFNNMKNYTIIKGDLMPPINIFEELFYSTEIWGYSGVLIIIVVGYLVMKKDWHIGIMYSVIVALATYQYFELFLANSDYIWHTVIVLFGWLFICVYRFFDR